MSDTLPPYPHYNSAYTYEARNLLVCPEGGHEWNLDEACNNGFSCSEGCLGTLLQYGDMVAMIKDLKVKGSSSVAKVW